MLDWRDGNPVLLGDIAEIRMGRSDDTNVAVQNGNPALSVRIDREIGANVLGTLNQVKDVVAELNAGELQREGLAMAQSFDASVFIYRAISEYQHRSGALL